MKCRVEIRFRRGKLDFVEAGCKYSMAEALAAFDPFQR